MIVFPLNRPKNQLSIQSAKPYADRVLTEEQREDCFYCQGCEVEMLDNDDCYIHPARNVTFCCEECSEEYDADGWA
ncbi:TPA: hypothetical protein ACGUTL_001090 [Vibrio vulnificus]